MCFFQFITDLTKNLRKSKNAKYVILIVDIWKNAQMTDFPGLLLLFKPWEKMCAKDVSKKNHATSLLNHTKLNLSMSSTQNTTLFLLSCTFPSFQNGIQQEKNISIRVLIVWLNQLCLFLARKQLLTVKYHKKKQNKKMKMLILICF